MIEVDIELADALALALAVDMHCLFKLQFLVEDQSSDQWMLHGLGKSTGTVNFGPDLCKTAF